MKKSILIAILIFLIVIGWFASGYFLSSKDYSQYTEEKSNNQNDNKNTENINKIKVETLLSKAETINQSISLQGQTKENRSIDIKAKTIGTIVNKNFTIGKLVKKDDIISEISIEDRKELKNSYTKEFERMEKEISLNKETKENNILKIQDQIKLYQIEFKTAKELLKKGLGSESKLTLAKFNLTQAETQLKEIIINFESKLINLESQLENVKSKIKNITIDINNTIISAPFDGIIQKSFIEEGQYIRQGDIIAKIVDLNPIKIQGYLSESDVNKVKVGTETNIKISNSLKKKGVISFISPVAETNTRTFEFIVEANNDDLLFKSGLTATILIEIESIKAHKISPSILSLDDNGNVGIKVLSEQNQVIFYQTKKIKDTIDGMWISGLPDKSNIIISGQEYVNVGEVIKIE
tara:strand:- start:431 stop:1660 length:1230 start_codon:yes stop_codon:yes gene_type:complete